MQQQTYFGKFAILGTGLGCNLLLAGIDAERHLAGEIYCMDAVQYESSLFDSMAEPCCPGIK